MTMVRFLACFLFLALAAPAGAQVTLVPSDRAPYHQKLDFQRSDAQYLLLPQGKLPLDEGPYDFRFRDPALSAVLEGSATVRYVSVRDGGFHVQFLHLRGGDLPAESLGPQEFEVVNAAGEVVGVGRMLVLARAPEAIDLINEEGTRLFEEGREARIRFRIRTNDNYAGLTRLGTPADFDLTDLREEETDTISGIVVVSGALRPLRRDAAEVRIGVETLDGRSVELAYSGLTVRPPAPRRARIGGGPIYLDALGRGTARISVQGIDRPLPPGAEIMSEGGGDLIVTEQRYQPSTGELTARIEFMARDPRDAAGRSLREIAVRAGTQVYRGHVEVVGMPAVSGVRTEQSGRATLIAGAQPAVVRITGQNLDDLRLDCSALGPGTTCRNQGSSPTEIVEEIAVAYNIPEGEYHLALRPTSRRPGADGSVHPSGGIRVQVERPAIPIALSTPGLLQLNCEATDACRATGEAGNLVVRRDALQDLRLLLDPAAIPEDRGWQKLVITVTRIRGTERQTERHTVRSYGSASSPRLFQAGGERAELALIDVTADPRHGDLFLVRVEHAGDRYPPQYQDAAVIGESYVRSIYVDGGRLKRLTGDIAVQPVLYTFNWNEEVGARDITPLYMNTGIGLTWQFLNARMEPRAYSVKFHLLATNIAQLSGGQKSSDPALFLSGNLRVPGTDPSRPLNLTGGVARMLTGDVGWRVLLGAGMDLGLYSLVSGN